MVRLGRKITVDMGSGICEYCKGTGRRRSFVTVSESWKERKSRIVEDINRYLMAGLSSSEILDKLAKSGVGKDFARSIVRTVKAQREKADSAV